VAGRVPVADEGRDVSLRTGVRTRFGAGYHTCYPGKRVVEICADPCLSFPRPVENGVFLW
jgi:hypothetical protein